MAICYSPWIIKLVPQTSCRPQVGKDRSSSHTLQVHTDHPGYLAWYSRRSINVGSSRQTCYVLGQWLTGPWLGQLFTCSHSTFCTDHIKKSENKTSPRNAHGISLSHSFNIGLKSGLFCRPQKRYFVNFRRSFHTVGTSGSFDLICSLIWKSKSALLSDRPCQKLQRGSKLRFPILQMCY